MTYESKHSPGLGTYVLGGILMASVTCLTIGTGYALHECNFKQGPSPAFLQCNKDQPAQDLTRLLEQR